MFQTGVRMNSGNIIDNLIIPYEMSYSSLIAILIILSTQKGINTNHQFTRNTYILEIRCLINICGLSLRIKRDSFPSLVSLFIQVFVLLFQL